MSHTEGPWYVDGDGVTIRGRGDKRVAMCREDWMADGEAAANARLIAAAPEMLECLQKVAAYLGPRGEHALAPFLREYVESVLQKAIRGEGSDNP
jgi:hypothetical protein